MRLIFSLLLICGPSYAQLAQIAPYNLYQPGVGTQDLVLPNTTDGSLDLLASGSMTRTLSAYKGSIIQFKVYLRDASAITGIYFSTNGCATTSAGNCLTFTPVYGAKITGPFTSNAVNTFTLATPLTVNRWDAFAIRVEVSTPHAANLALLSAQLFPSSGLGNQQTINEACYYQTNAAKQATFTLASMTKIPNAGMIVIGGYGPPPLLAGIGDSIMASKSSSPDTIALQGAPVYPMSGNTFYAIPYYWAINYSASVPVYQSTGIPGELMAGVTGIAARMTDLTNIKPAYGLVQGGINDIIVTCTSSGCSGAQITTIETAFSTSMAALQTAHIGCFVMLVGPYTAGSTAQMQNADTINANTISTAPSYGCTVIDWRCTVGQFRAGGSAGNCWDYQAALTVDGLHPNQAGTTLIGILIASKLPNISGNSGVSGGSSPSGSGGIF